LIEKETLPISVGGVFHDIDEDGDLDVVFSGDWQSNKIWWWENPYPDYDPEIPWTRYEIKNSGEKEHHDQIFGDFDDDGEMELVFWNQNAKKLFIADIPPDPKNVQMWPYQEIWSGDSYFEGLSKGDLEGDGTVDILGGGRWFKYNGGSSYTPSMIDDAMRVSRVVAGNFKTGIIPQVIMLPAEGIGRLKLYECNGDPKDPSCWVGQDILGFDVDHGHSLDVADLNGDGKLDIFVAKMHLNGENSDSKMWILWGDGNGNFKEEVVATGYDNHESRVADLDGDGDIDILGKPFNYGTPGLDIWINDPAPDLYNFSR
jgi:hypothetical protein